MTSLWSIGAGRRAKAKIGAEDSKTNGVKKSAASMRIMGDMAELDLPDNCKLIVPNKDDLMKFSVAIRPDSGYWKTASYEFSFAIPDNYPYKPPKVKCVDKIYHPNIDLNGAVCLNILKESWRPVLNIQNVIHGLLFLLLDPNPTDPLNQEAAEIMRNNAKQFEKLVLKSLRGGNIAGVVFPKNN